MKIQIYASEITNLTDARYFAAVGVDFLGFCCEQGHHSFIPDGKIREIVEWVEGPVGILQFTGIEDQEKMNSSLSATSCTGLHLGIGGFEVNNHPPVLFKDVLPEMISYLPHQKNVNYILKVNNRNFHPSDELIAQIKSLCEKNVCFIDLEYYSEYSIEIIKLVNPAGIVIKGSVEEKTGIKSYDILDELFDTILN